MNKLTLEEAENTVNQYCNIKINLLEFNGYSKLCKVECTKCGNIFTASQFGNLLRKAKRHNSVCHECAVLEKRKKSFEEELNKRFPDEPFEILSFAGTHSPGIIKCKKCGTVKELACMKEILNNKHICSVCFPSRYEETQNRKKNFLKFINDSDKWTFIDNDFDNKNGQDKIKCKCNKCGYINEKTMITYMKGFGCPNCYGNRPLTTEEFKERLDEDYELIGEYHGSNRNVLLKHLECGFIFKMTPDAYLHQFQRCPRCKRKQSIGEQLVAQCLDKYNITYIQEFPVTLENRHLRFDFYLPDLNKYIEFNGKQHYAIIPKMTPTEEMLKDLQYRDNLKKQYAKDNLLVICYKDINRIEEIISSQKWFNDYLEKE